jgi:F-type H+-transporting ATPase subunit epsilon
MIPEFQCTVVTPERTVCDVISEFVALTLYDGEIGIAPGRVPMIGRLGCGEMRITHEGQTSRYYVEGGFVEVAGDVVTVLTDRAVPADQLDQAVIQEQLDAARARRATTPETMAARDHAVALSRAQLRVARRAALP